MGDILNTTDLVIVIPTYNEADNLPGLMQEIFALGLPATVVIVDDGSPDGTASVALEIGSGLSGSDGQILVVDRGSKQGLGTAYQAGFHHALSFQAKYVVQMDADGSHSPQAIPGMLSELRAGADVVVGSRYIEGGGVDASWSFKRRFLSSFSNRMIRAIVGLEANDVTAGFKAYRSAALARLPRSGFRCKGFGFQTEVALACQRRGFKVAEYPITFTDRTAGKSKMSLHIMAEAFWRLALLRFGGTR